MTPGALTVDMNGVKVHAVLAPGGWACDPPHMTKLFDEMFPPLSSPYPPFWDHAFTLAVNYLKSLDMNVSVEEEPEAGPFSPDVVY